MIFKESKAKPLVITAPAARAQIRDASTHPFQSVFNDYTPLKHNIGLFRSLREAIPFINIGILKRRKLVGSFEFTEVNNAAAEKALIWLKNEVCVNWLQFGLDSFISEKVNSAFEAGTGYGEMVVGETGPRLHHLETAKPDNIRFVRDKETGQWLIARYVLGSIEPVPFPEQEKITYLAFDTRDGHPQGYSLLYGLPFVAQILLRQEKSWENMAFRFGDPTEVVVYTAADGEGPAEATATANSIKSQISSSMTLRKKGQTADVEGAIPFGSKLEIKTLGADAKIEITEISIRTVLEQTVAVTDLPPYMLGLSWSTTERMSKDQADMVVGNIRHERSAIEKNIRNIADYFLINEGYTGISYVVDWNDVNLLDEVEQAKAKLYDAQANQKIIESTAQMIDLGWLDQESGQEYLIHEGIIKGKLPDGWYKSTKGIRFAQRIAREYLGS